MAENHSSLHQGDYVEREREREREIVDVLKIGPIPFIDFNGIVLYLSLFGVKKQR